MGGRKVGFIGLGVMGEPMCLNLVRRSGCAVSVSDIDTRPVERLVAAGAAAASVAELAHGSDILLLSLPSGTQVEAVLGGPSGVLANARPGLIVVDHSTSPVELTRTLAKAAAEVGVRYADAPVARTRQAAIDGTLAIMVGADADVFEAIHPILRCMASDVVHCGDVGCGQVVKIINNMVLFQTVVALSEALAMGEAAGVDGRLLFETLSKGSADSFALRNHGMKAMLPRDFPVDAFPTDYALKDVGYALDLASYTGVRAQGAELARDRLKKASANDLKREYFPVLSTIVDRA